MANDLRRMQRLVNAFPVGAGTAVLLLSCSATAVAAIQDYQIARLVAMKSESVHDQLRREDESDDGVVFHVSCANSSHYPDGVRVVCDDPEYASSCQIQTEAREYNFLEMLQSGDRSEEATQ